MDDAHNSVNTIAAAVEVQSGSTREVAENMTQATDLSRLADEIKTAVHKFKI